MENDWVDFRTVKASTTMQQVLDHYGIPLRKVNATYLRGKCPLPTHASSGSDNSFGVDIGKQVWACQSDSCVKGRNGRRGGNVLEFVAVKEGVTIREAALKLSSWFSIVSPAPAKGPATPKGLPASAQESAVRDAKPPGKIENDEPVVPNKPLPFALKGVDPSHVYLKGRGITEETSRLFGVGYFAGNGSMKERVVFPIRNRGGDIVAYAGRAVEDSVEPRWKFPSGFRKSLELFGIHEAAKSSTVVVVESFWGVLALHQIGIAAVALMGRSMSEDQCVVLGSLGSVSITILLDGDDPGRAATPDIAVRLARQQFVRIVSLPADKQPDHLKPDDLRQLFGVSANKPHV